MKKGVWFLVLELLVAGCAHSAEPAAGEADKPVAKAAELIIRAPTAGEAANSFMLFLGLIGELAGRDYSFRLPDHPAFQALRQRKEPLTEEEREKLKDLFAKEIYDKNAYAPAIEALEERRAYIEEALANLMVLHKNWGFAVFPTCEVIFNRYPGLGAGHPLSGKVNMCVDERGAFRCAFGDVPSPEVVVVHEIVHTGIGVPLVERFQLSWFEEERLVDLICRDYLGRYSKQGHEDHRLDEFVDRNAIINDLPGAIEKYVQAHPRSEEEEPINIWWRKWDW